MSLLPIVVPIVQAIAEQSLSGTRSNSPVGVEPSTSNFYIGRTLNQNMDMDEKMFNRGDEDIEFRGRSPNYGRKDIQFRTFPTNSTWDSNFSTALNSYQTESESRFLSKLRSIFRKTWNFLFRRDDSQSIDDVVPYYRWLPILSGVTIPFSILLQIPGCTERWYVRTLDNKTIQSRPNPPILLAANILAMLAALIANIALITRFLEKKVKRMTILSLLMLSVHDVINAVTVTIFGIEHRFNDGFTYGQPFWLVVASTVVSLFTTVTLSWDLWKTPDFSKSGSGLTRKQRSLVVIVMILLCWITFGGLVNSILLHLTYIDGLYFTVVSIETIGFGDIHPNSTSSRIFAIIYNSIGIVTIGLTISTARETIIESFEVSYRLRLHEVTQKRGEYKKIKERERTRKHVIERMLRTMGLPAFVPDPAKSGKMKLNEEALTPEQVINVEKETIFLMNRRYQHQLSSRGPTVGFGEVGGFFANGGGVGGVGIGVPGASAGGGHGVTFERTFSLDSTVSDIVSSQMYEENYREFKDSILREERREFAAKITVALIIFLVFWLIGAVIFSQTEKWSYGISLYFCFVAFSSIGYGDYAPATPAGRSVFVVWALMGVAAMTILVSVLCEACSSRYKSALSGGSFQRAVKNFRKRREVSPSPHFHHRVHSQTQSQSRGRGSPSRRLYYNSNGNTGLVPPVINPGVGNTLDQQYQTQLQVYTIEQAKRDLEGLPSELLNHARTFHDHVFYFMGGLGGGGDEPLPAPLERLLNEMAESEHMAEGLKKEVLRDDGARRALFMMSYEGALQKMIQTAQRAVTLISRRDLLNISNTINNNTSTNTSLKRVGDDSESKISKLSTGLDLADGGGLSAATTIAHFDEQRYSRRPTPAPLAQAVHAQEAETETGPEIQDADTVLNSAVR